jgi:hypothetical protein
LLAGWIAIVAVACASGKAGDPDAPVSSMIDARVTADAPPGTADAPVSLPDAPPGTPDASVGTPDASTMIDASGACPAIPQNPSGCPSCGATCEEPWPVAWTAVTGATHYIIQYSCFISMPTYQTPNTTADLCSEVGMCTNDDCAFGAGAVTVKACNATCCSAAVTIPIEETPIACGGGVCC